MVIEELAPLLQARVVGDASVTILHVAGAARADVHSLVFAENEASLRSALTSAAGAVLVREVAATDKTLLVVANPRLAFAQAARHLRKQSAEAAPAVHATAVLGANVSLGPRVRIDAGCVVGEGVSIGAGSHLYPRVVIYSGCALGERVTIHAGAVLGSDGFGYVRDPATGEYVQTPQQGTLVLENDVEVGANTTIDRGALEETRIGAGTKIDNLVHIGHNVCIGRNVVIAAQTGISGSCTIGDGAVLGGQVGMGDHVTIGPGVILGGGSGVLPHKIVEGPGELFWGTPARPVKQILREQATLSRLARRPRKSRGGG